MRDDPTVVLDPYNVHPDPADESVGLEPPLYARNIRPADVAGRDAELRELHARHARQREVVAIRNLHKRIRWALDDSVQAERALMPQRPTCSAGRSYGAERID